MDTLLNSMLDFYSFEAYLIIFGILLLCGVGLPIPEDITLIVAGALAFYHVIEVGPAIVVGLVGVLCGDAIMFFLGRHYGRKLALRWPFNRMLTEERLNSVGKQLNEKGDKLLFAARFMPGLRAPIYFSAGVLHIPFRKFIVYDGSAALLSVPAIVGGVYYFGDQLDHAVAMIKKVEHGIVFVIFAVILYLVGKRAWSAFKSGRPGQGGSSSSGGKAAGLLLLAACSLQSAEGLAATGPVTPDSPMTTEAAASEASAPSDAVLASKLQQWCADLSREVKRLNWKVEPCQGLQWKARGLSVRGRPLVFAEWGNPEATNTTLILSTIHGDEVTPAYLGLQLAHWLELNLAAGDAYRDTRVVLAPMVNPDSFFRRPKSRVNAHGVDVNRNFPTRDWDAKALAAWKARHRSDPRRFPGSTADTEPETHFQRWLIDEFKPQKILSIHAPLNFMDYDGPTQLALAKFPSEYVQECLKLRKRLKATSGGFFPGSLGNYAGQERGIPTLTLELPSADARRAHSYWEQFRSGIRTMIEYRMPDYSMRVTANAAEALVESPAVSRSTLGDASRTSAGNQP